MTAHGSGNGTSWDELAPDIDQPHGLDYREFQHLKIGVRKRLSQQHTTFADNTAGGIHKPGGTSVLNLTDATTDITISVADGSWQGFGLVYSSPQGALYCFTKIGDQTQSAVNVKFGPKSICTGSDFTWTGIHQFDASVDMTNSCVQGTFCIAGTGRFIGVTDVSNALNVANTLTCSSSFTMANCLTTSGGFLDEDDLISDASSKVPSQQSVKAYVDAVNAKLPSGLTGVNDSNGETAIGELQLKWGDTGAVADAIVTFTNAFSNYCFQVFVCFGDTAGDGYAPLAHTITKNGFTVTQHDDAILPVRWFAIGR